MRRLLPALGVGLLCACASSAPPQPRLLGLSPSQGEDESPVAVRISGSGFAPRVRTDFSDPKASALDSGYLVTLVPVGGVLPEVELGEVRIASSEQLEAVVPVGVARGSYGVRVTDPWGHQTQLTEVYRVVRSARFLAGFRIEPLGAQRVGVPFWVQVTAVDVEGNPVDGFAQAVSMSDRTESLSPTSLGPFALGRAQAQVTIGATTSSDVIEVADGAGHAGKSNGFAVMAALAGQIAFDSAPQTVPVGSCSSQVEVEVRDGAGRPAPVDQALTIRLAAAPPDRFAFYSDSACQTKVEQIEVATGASRADFFFRGEKAGPLVLRASPDRLPGATQAEILSALEPSKVVWASPSVPLKQAVCSPVLELQLADPFDNDVVPAFATSVSLSSAPSAALSFFSDDACSAAISSVELDSAGRARLYARANAAGTAVASAFAAGLEPARLTLTVTP